MDTGTFEGADRQLLCTGNSFERNITIIKGNSSLGTSKVLIIFRPCLAVDLKLKWDMMNSDIKLDLS